MDWLKRGRMSQTKGAHRLSRAVRRSVLFRDASLHGGLDRFCSLSTWYFRNARTAATCWSAEKPVEMTRRPSMMCQDFPPFSSRMGITIKLGLLTSRHDPFLSPNPLARWLRYRFLDRLAGSIESRRCH